MTFWKSQGSSETASPSEDTNINDFLGGQALDQESIEGDNFRGAHHPRLEDRRTEVKLRVVRTYSSVLQSLLDQPLLYWVKGGGVLDTVVLHRVRVVVTLTHFTAHSSVSIPLLFWKCQLPH